ncbi:MAG: hypothetical protein ACI9HK_003900 [Pirellulaceae bacterium]|jgi:hypothetical protein
MKTYLLSILVAFAVLPTAASLAQPGGPPPPPPVLTTLDANGDGEISAAEIRNATMALLKLDMNKDGELGPEELRPARGFGRGIGDFLGGIFGGSASGEIVPPENVAPRNGAATIPNLQKYHELSYRGEEVMIDTFLADLEFVKFTLDQASTDNRQLYFINTNTHRAHMMFAQAVGISPRGGDQMKGVLVYRPRLKSPSGQPGLFTIEFEPFDAYSYEMVNICRNTLIEKMPLLKGNLGYYPRGNRALAKCEGETAKYEAGKLPIYLDEDLSNADVGYLPLNLGASFGRLRLMKLDELPGPRDIVIYKTLPNEMPRTGGIITAVRQTPLSHVNLRAIQDKVPNAFITEADSNKSIATLIGKFVAYSVTPDGYQIREATPEEVDQHFEKLRPATPQSPKRDLSVKQIRSLDSIEFKDSAVFGVKATNTATLRQLGFPDATVPNGAAVPFYYYDEFMKHNKFYEHAEKMLASPQFKNDRATQQAELKKFRALIKSATMPEWMMKSLAELQQTFTAGSSVRCRSSTNNEDLPGFSGAGLYDSYTHHPDEGHFSKSIKQVYASLWNFRAFEEREFYRVDHFTTAMGVLVHPNFKGELANGVAVTDDILYQSQGNYYLNVQTGEDLVTNPNEASVPEEGLLDWFKSSKYSVVRSSNRAQDDKPLLSPEQLEQLRSHLGKIHSKFAKLYGKDVNDEAFAMEIEFKITKDGILSIKQARPWVFGGE